MKALIFDFDGLIVDTEVAEFEAWREVYAGHGAELTLEVWADVVGSAQGYFDPVAYLEGLIGRPVDRAKVQAQRRRRTMEIIEELPILPGVLEYLDEARDRGLLLGVASNSSHEWVEGHLARKGLLDRFDVIRCAEDVEKAKPARIYICRRSAPSTPGRMKLLPLKTRPTVPGRRWPRGYTALPCRAPSRNIWTSVLPT